MSASISRATSTGALSICMPDMTSSKSSDGVGESDEMSEDILRRDDDCDPPEDYREYGDWKQEYANSVGMRLYDK